jgi:hypothetical protein
MKNKILRKKFFLLPRNQKHSSFFYREVHDTLAMIILLLVTTIGVCFYLPRVQAVGINDILASVPDGSDGTGTSAQVTVTFGSSVLIDTEQFTIYLGDNTSGGHNWVLGSVTTGTSACTSGDGTFTDVSITPADASLPLRYTVTATAAGTGTVTCTIGDGGSINPTNPNLAGAYSVEIVTSNDSGAGTIYIGDTNDVGVSVNMLSNLALSISGADGTYCTTTSGVTTCNLGTALTTNVVSGYYDVHVGSNAASGVTLYLGENHDLQDGGGTHNIDDIGAHGTVSFGTEGYGIAATTAGTWTIDSSYTPGDNPIVTGPDVLATTTAPIDILGNPVHIVHKAAISSTTYAASYSHTATWTVTGNF